YSVQKGRISALASHRLGSAARHHVELGAKRDQSWVRQWKPCWTMVYRRPCAGQFFYIPSFRIMGQRRHVYRKWAAGFDAGGPRKLGMGSVEQNRAATVPSDRADLDI